jgi:hypothetical protein
VPAALIRLDMLADCVQMVPTDMPVKFLGKLLFPHLAPWQRKQQTRILFWAVLVAVIFAVVAAAIMLFENGRR